MIWLQCFLKTALILCCIIGLIFMIVSTIFVIISIVRGNISIHVIKDEAGNEMEDKRI